MNIQTNYSLTDLNTFGVNVASKYFVEVFSTTELKEVLADKILLNNKWLILGGGSNILFTKNFDGLIIKNSISGITVISENDREVFIEAGAGVNWDKLVEYCVNNNYGGIENLSLIPGSVGAAPVQNIGAYGQELKDSFCELTGIYINTGEEQTFSKTECKFEYRNSIFKNELRNEFAITSIQLKLNKNPDVILSYLQVKDEISTRNIFTPTISDVRNAVIDIRNAKLPDPKKIGNAGSFFKNPVVDLIGIHSLKEKFPDIKSFPEGKDKFKISAAWLIEKCGWKEKIIRDAGVYLKQPLVIVNYGSASGNDIHELAKKIRASVEKKFDITLENEVNII
ncbi:UDP-N-acetylmuramate dehydrogenase [Bacteroidota bacterium]